MCDFVIVEVNVLIVVMDVVVVIIDAVIEIVKVRIQVDEGLSESFKRDHERSLGVQPIFVAVLVKGFFPLIEAVDLVIEVPGWDIVVISFVVVMFVCIVIVSADVFSSMSAGGEGGGKCEFHRCVKVSLKFW